jgi:hypothetical protein
MLTPLIHQVIVRKGWSPVMLPWLKGERVLVVSNNAQVKAAKERFPGLVDYLLEEIALIEPLVDDLMALNNIHLVKKHIGGRVRVLPSENIQTV